MTAIPNADWLTVWHLSALSPGVAHHCIIDHITASNTSAVHASGWNITLHWCLQHTYTHTFTLETCVCTQTTGYHQSVSSETRTSSSRTDMQTTARPHSLHLVTIWPYNICSIHITIPALPCYPIIMNPCSSWYPINSVKAPPTAMTWGKKAEKMSTLKSWACITMSSRWQISQCSTGKSKISTVSWSSATYIYVMSC